MRVEVGRNSLDSIRGLVSDVPGARYISVFVSMKPLRLLSMISTFFLNYELDFNLNTIKLNRNFKNGLEAVS